MNTFIINNAALYLCFQRPRMIWNQRRNIDRVQEKIRAERWNRLDAYLDGLSTSKRDATAYTTTVFYEMPGTVRRDAKGRFARKVRHK